MKVGARILYYADGCDTFAEHELDYIIFLKPKELTINFNKDEVKQIAYVSLNDINNFLKERK